MMDKNSNESQRGKAPDQAQGPARLRRSTLGAATLLAVLAASLVVATYAWFTSNARVNTNEVTVRSDDDRLEFRLGDADSGTWSTDGDAALTTNSPLVDGVMTLYPVSTFDLDGFAECVSTNADGQAAGFEQAADGQKFYHGWIDMRADLTGTAATAQGGNVKLYLSQAPVPGGADATLLRAARVGLKLSRGGDVLKTCIFELDVSAGANRAEHPTTAPAGLAGYTDGMLLGWSGGVLACAADVSEGYDGYVMGTSADAGRPANTLLAMDLGTVYRLDVYYYIEGTDPDSADYLDGSAGTLSLGLYAVLDGTGE